MNLAGRVTTGTLLLLPGALTVYLSFNAGGFFPNTTAFAALVLAVALALRVALAEAPFEGFGTPVAIAAGGLALFALWALLSGRWSHAPGRALIEFDRALLYLLALVLFGSLARSAANVRWMVRGLAAGIVAVCACGLATRVLPNVFPVAATIANNRLSYPLTYWNSLGLLASIGIILCFHHASSASEPPVARVLGAAAVPLVAPTLLFTFSRGAIAAGIAGFAAYLLLGRPRALISGLLATVPAATIAVVVSYDADQLATLTPTSRAAVDQGHGVAIAVGACIAGAAILRTLLLSFDARLSQVRLPPVPRPVLASAAVALIAATVVIAIVAGAPSGIAHQYDRFVSGTPPGSAQDLRTRLTNPSNNGRLDHWDVALDAFAGNELAGNGAGTYQNLWAQHRPDPVSVRDGHSLYVEVLGELGVVGLGLILVPLLTILVMLVRRIRGSARTLYAALFGAALTWALHAGVDWDWEMPAVTIWLFAIGGAALAASRRRRQTVRALHPVARIGAIVGCFAIAIVPGLVLVSQMKLDDSADAFARGDCAAASADARSSRSALGVRPEPYEMLAFCERRGSPRAVGLLEQAVDRDPDNWTYRYDLALAQGAAGLDPRVEARQALRLNPLDTEAQDLARLFSAGRKATWKRDARVLLSGASPYYLSER